MESRIESPLHASRTLTAPPIAAEVRNLRLKFPGSPELLFRDLSLQIRQGEKVLLLGPSGCGKSTLLQVLGGIIPRVNEVPLKADKLIVPYSTGIVFQDPDTQFCMPYVDEELAFVLENLAVPRAEMPRRIEQALREVGLNLPDAHVPIGSLSQGMKQRLALASALLLEPDTLLLDEPSALLDPEGRRVIWEAVRAVSDRRTVIIVEHRVEEVLHWADRVVLFAADGSILADDAPERIFERYRAEMLRYGIWYPQAWNDAYGSEQRSTAEAPPSRIARTLSGQADTPNEPTALETWSGSGSGKSAVSAEAIQPVASAVSAPSYAYAPSASASGEAAAVSASPDRAEPLLRLDDFRVLRGGKTVCAAASAAAYPGDLIALTGPNGAGKSSLLLGLMGLLPHEGSCECAGGRPSGRKQLREAAAKHAAFVFQNPEFQFVTNRVLDEVLFTLRSEAEAALRAPRGGGFAGWLAPRRRARLDAVAEAELLRQSEACLERFGLGDYAERHPYLLSLGQKRRLSVASAIVSDKPLLLLDEPTFGQDARNAFAILDLCERLRASGHAVLMITHEMEIAERLATQIWTVEQGKLSSVWQTARSRDDELRLSEGGRG
ncbi:ABC transporter ATP-binding protein [Saccharibacillus sacchari]|uniref:ABC transporter ATP-binding protein n=1 Tax=Saccharibacillus sacchari TaxID=456493 RepID=A0ACC6PAD8_9BACL